MHDDGIAKSSSSELDGNHAVKNWNIVFYIVLMFEWTNLTVFIDLLMFKAINDHKMFFDTKIVRVETKEVR